jgi:4-hydroxy-2-oxoheptanedioate aldolase
MVGLHRFMQGLVDGGPTRSGHRTPTVIATLPSNCRTREEVYANSWQARHILSAGVHGLYHTHARQPSAVQAFVEACRFPFQKLAVGEGLGPGERGAGGEAPAAQIWGIDALEYVKIADPWPLNPGGELLLGIKIEDREGEANAGYLAGTPGIAWAEWGPGDMNMSYGYEVDHDSQRPPYPPELESARETIKQACDDAGIAFLSAWDDGAKSVEENVRFLLDWGVKILHGDEDVAVAGRSMTGRTMPV